MAAELARLTGETLTSAVMTALEVRLDDERKKRGGGTTADQILAFARAFAPGMAPGVNSASHADLLYGEDGLPR